MELFSAWEAESSKGRTPVPLADAELELNYMPEEYQKKNDVSVKTFYERLEIKKQGGEIAIKESFKISGSLRFIWTMEERRLRLKDGKEEIRDGACNAAEKMEKGLSNPGERVEDYCEKTSSDAVATEER
ncbi:uncharacterized protein EAE98_006693 [Botrytis deweyae]|uniref:Uncharacterized protein n=1 Tax=Botrytis deweyae TaxID=2478750 RepID=A0ABQ7IK28_9HELO|nr:uncharacterized protein EAE98_006693 [Botrytis deweyae]KAF7926398.1 hypothetical protein EAE98_006693 [Botrytis deweyae]